MRFCRAATALACCLIWARSTGDRRTYGAAAFELALIDLYLKDDPDWAPGNAPLGVAFNKSRSEHELMLGCIAGFDETYLFTADSLSWFYMNILQALLPTVKRIVPLHTQGLMGGPGREYDLASQLQEAVKYSIDSENRYNRAGLLSALVAIRFVDPQTKLRLIRRAREHAEFHGYTFITAVADFLLWQDPDYLLPVFWGPTLSRDQRSKIMQFGLQDIANLRDPRGDEEGWGNLLRLL